MGVEKWHQQLQVKYLRVAKALSEILADDFSSSVVKD